MTQSSLKRKAFIWLTFPLHRQSSVEVRVDLKQEPVARAEAEAMEECCLLACSACFLIGPRTTGGIITMGLALLYQSLIKKMQTGSQAASSREIFLNCGSPFSDNSSLCQVDKVTTN